MLSDALRCHQRRIFVYLPDAAIFITPWPFLCLAEGDAEAIVFYYAALAWRFSPLSPLSPPRHFFADIFR